MGIEKIDQQHLIENIVEFLGDQANLSGRNIRLTGIVHERHWKILRRHHALVVQPVGNGGINYRAVHRYQAESQSVGCILQVDIAIVLINLDLLICCCIVDVVGTGVWSALTRTHYRIRGLSL